MLTTITLTFTQTLDGRIATLTGESRYISDAGSLDINQQLRRDYDAIAVGIGTVLKDDPLLTCRIAKKSNPVRIILDQTLKTPLESQLAQTSAEVKTIVFYNKKMLTGKSAESFQSRKIALEKKHVETIGITENKTGRLDLTQVIRHLEKYGIKSLMVEGGSSVLTSFIKENLWTNMVVISTAKITGQGIPSVGNLGIESLKEIIVPLVKKIEVIGNEVCWYLHNPPAKRKISSRTLYFTSLETVELRNDILTIPTEGKKLVHSRMMGISPGTERQIYMGNFIQGKPFNPEIDRNEGKFTWPFSYGYINVVEDEQGGRRYFGFLHHSERILVDEEELFPLEDDLDDELALFIPHIETAISIIHDSQPKLGDRILITGAGVVGTLTSRVLGEIMNIDCLVYDIDNRKKIWFPNGNFNSDPDFSMEQFDLCIETSGSPRGLETCMECSKRDGRVVVASWYGEKALPLNLGNDFHWKRLKLISSQVSHMSPMMGKNWNKERRLKLSAELAAKIKPKNLLTHRFPFSKSDQAYKLLTGKEELYGLVALIPWS